ncbi:uncharacterized protein LOC121255166 [Juglans microcarpa x Juglans regia]|uniref:uncharacterized protein LOC121255166 n=1 Tax=Juglans microcarpa x Juglans regia TaxID=2249226 RepID=UPI001B7F299B|nr:uncharacterized protein LOC121255166 [Juglans microcarpa x Juglans regia]
MEAFRSVLNDCELKDLGFAGSCYTWCNRREADDRICERFDRCLANAKWVDLFSAANVQHGSGSYSDHVLVWLDTNGAFQNKRGKMMFRFKAMWLGNTNCEHIIENTWQGESSSNYMIDAMHRIRNCSGRLASWNKKTFGVVHKKLIQAQSKLQRL